MLIDMLSASLAKSGALDDAWAKLDSGQDATVGVASSAPVSYTHLTLPTKLEV